MIMYVGVHTRIILSGNLGYQIVTPYLLCITLVEVMTLTFETGRLWKLIGSKCVMFKDHVPGPQSIEIFSHFHNIKVSEFLSVKLVVSSHCYSIHY